MASVQNIGLNGEKLKGENDFTSPKTDMPKEPCLTPPNKSPSMRESYWFAHGGIEDHSAGNIQTDQKPGGDDKESQLQKDKEERIRMFREHQEEERLKKLKELEQQFMMSKKHREQQEEERRKRIEEARVREIERRHQVEERKRQIWEAEQERKEAILRRNMEREARIEARRNAQRNSQCFAFGSSTPRSFDLDLAAIGIGRSVNAGSVLMSSVSSRRSEDRELGPPRATSACSLDRKFGEDCMSRSMVSLSSSTFRGRKRTDIMPTLTRERSITPHITPRGNQSMRAVSMTRLDQLAQPRRTYRDPRSPVAIITTTTPNGGPRTVSPSMSKSMCNLANSSAMSRRAHAPVSASNSNGSMSRSMLHLADSPSQRDNRRLSPSPTQPKIGMRPAQSMMHLAAPPRLTRAARLRAQALAGNRAASAWNLNKADTTGHYLSPGKDTSCSPSRPQSSMSGTSEISATSSSVSGVVMRVRPAPRRPRPFSIAGSTVDSTVHTNLASTRRESERQPRLPDRNAPALAPKPDRAKSASREKADVKNIKPLVAPKKPVPPPKSSEVLARAKAHPVPTKDNLRRVNATKPANKLSDEVKVSKNQEDKLNAKTVERIDSNTKQEQEVNSNVSSSEAKAISPLTSSTLDMEAFPSPDDSKASTTAEGSISSLNQSAAETAAESAAEDKQQNNDIGGTKQISTLEKIPLEQVDVEKDETPNIPIATEEKVVEAEKQPLLTPESTEETENVKDLTQSKPRITSEEQARAALAEKRRLAREQAEREAELERQRLEEIRRKEEEQKRLEEAEQKRMEEEQIRLAELHRQLEEEKLRRAIEEQQQREKEEEEKREEESRQKAEREEQEKKAREEAEKQRIELEEKLRKEEEERAERKRRVEQIMARTRGKMAQSPAGSPSESNPKLVKDMESSNSNSVTAENTVLPSPLNDVQQSFNGVKEFVTVKSTNSMVENHFTSSSTLPFPEETQTVQPLPDLLNSETIANHTAKMNGQYAGSEEQLSKISVSNSFTISNKIMSANVATSPQSNGYSSHEEMSCTTSPEEDTDAGLLIDIQSCQQKSSIISPVSTDFTKLVELDPPSLDNNVNNENFLINVDDINSNLFNSANPFVGFDDSLQKKQDNPVTDLLS